MASLLFFVEVGVFVFVCWWVSGADGALGDCAEGEHAQTGVNKRRLSRLEKSKRFSLIFRPKQRRTRPISVSRPTPIRRPTPSRPAVRWKKIRAFK